MAADNRNVCRRVRRRRLVNITLLALSALGLLAAALPAAAVLTPAQRESVHCLGCHTGNAKHFTNPETGAKKDVLVDIHSKRDSDHAKVPCQDCHVEGFNGFPHEDVKIKGCMDCHPRQDAAGAKEDAPFNFPRIEREFRTSVHFTELKDKFNKDEDFITGIHFTITKTGDGFPCSQCHHPHYMKTAAELGAPGSILETHNKWCTSCHAAEPEQPVNTILGVAWSDVTDPAEPSLVAEHASLPHAAQHLQSARCVDCHSGTEHANSHELFLGSNTPGCESCHTRDSALSELYRYVKNDPAGGFTNSAILKDSYIMGATRYLLLDILGYVLLGGALLAAASYSFLRLIRRRRRHGDRGSKDE